MKRLTISLVLVACGFFTASTPLFAQDDANPAANWFSGKTSLLLLGRGDVASSRFEEYREYPKGVSMPTFDLAGSHNGKSYALFSEGISQRDQRYRGFLNVGWATASVDYNQIMHNIGFQGQTIVSETAPGVYSMSKTLRTSLQNTYDTTPSALRIYPWLLDLYLPTLSSQNFVDVTLQRNRGTYAFDMGKGHPVGLTMTYFRETRVGAKDTTPIYVSSQTIELPTPTDFLTQDFALNGALDKKWGNVHAAYSYNWFNDKLTILTVDNPLRDSDAPYVNSIGGPAQGVTVLPPDNSASTYSGGTLLKFAKQTRVMADVALSQWKQNANLQPYTLNTAILLPSGANASALSSRPFTSLNGQIDTTTINLGVTSRPLDPLYVNLKYRDYDFNNKTPRLIQPGYVGWDRAWTAGPNETDPFGYETKRFDGIAGYELSKSVAVELAYRNLIDDRTLRQAERTTENGVAVTAIVHGSNWSLLRATYDKASRTASGIEAGVKDLYFDQANRDSDKVGFDLEVSPTDALTVVGSYYYRKDNYQNPTFGYQSAKYNMFSGEVDLAANSHASLNFYYTYEVNQDGHKGYQTISNVQEWYTSMADDKTNSVGGSVTFHIVPDRWTLLVDGNYQKVNGLMRFAGSPAIQNTRAGNGGIKDIPNHDDTTYSTIRSELAYALAKSWNWTFGGFYRDYKYDDASSTSTLPFPQSNFPMAGLFTLSPNNGSYHVVVGYTSMTYRF